LITLLAKLKKRKFYQEENFNQKYEKYNYVFHVSLSLENFSKFVRNSKFKRFVKSYHESFFGAFNNNGLNFGFDLKITHVALTK
jgi:hypothetical protein